MHLHCAIKCINKMSLYNAIYTKYTTSRVKSCRVIQFNDNLCVTLTYVTIMIVILTMVMLLSHICDNKHECINRRVHWPFERRFRNDGYVRVSNNTGCSIDCNLLAELTIERSMDSSELVIRYYTVCKPLLLLFFFFSFPLSSA